jgi:hypothetical protein
MQRTTSTNMTVDSERRTMIDHRPGGADDLDTARRSRTYTATSAITRARLSGISQKSSAATMAGNTSQNHTNDDAFTVSVRAPIHVIHFTTGRGLLGVGIGTASMLAGPRLTNTTAERTGELQTAARATRRPGR